MKRRVNDGTRYYIAYGSNLNVLQMKRRCPGATIFGTAKLRGWQLWFKGSRTGSYLTIEENDGEVGADGDGVPVVIWEVSPADEDILDRYEGYPRFYYKRNLPVVCKEIRTGKKGRISAFVYVMHEDRPFGVPSEQYMDICREGYDTFHFDKSILEEARERSCYIMTEAHRILGGRWDG